jgi:hypothetical protein
MKTGRLIVKQQYIEPIVVFVITGRVLSRIRKKGKTVYGEGPSHHILKR